MSQVKQVCFDRLLPKDTRRAIRFMSFGTGQTTLRQWYRQLRSNSGPLVKHRFSAVLDLARTR